MEEQRLEEKIKAIELKMPGISDLLKTYDKPYPHPPKQSYQIYADHNWSRGFVTDVFYIKLNDYNIVVANWCCSSWDGYGHSIIQKNHEIFLYISTKEEPKIRSFYWDSYSVRDKNRDLLYFDKFKIETIDDESFEFLMMNENGDTARTHDNRPNYRIMFNYLISQYEKKIKHENWMQEQEAKIEKIQSLKKKIFREEKTRGDDLDVRLGRLESDDLQILKDYLRSFEVFPEKYYEDFMYAHVLKGKHGDEKGEILIRLQKGIKHAGLHRHGLVRDVLVYSGRGQFEFVDEKFNTHYTINVQEGDIISIPMNIFHNFSSHENDMKIYAIHRPFQNLDYRSVWNKEEKFSPDSCTKMKFESVEDYNLKKPKRIKFLLT